MMNKSKHLESGKQIRGWKKLASTDELDVRPVGIIAKKILTGQIGEEWLRSELIIFASSFGVIEGKNFDVCQWKQTSRWAVPMKQL